MASPALSASPSHAKIFSTRPAEREATWTSSTSIVPETALFWRRHPERSASADRAMTNQKRMKVARHYAHVTLGKEMAGYSKTPLAQKLGIKAQTKVAALHAPVGYGKLLAPLPADVSFAEKAIVGSS